MHAQSDLVALFAPDATLESSLPFDLRVRAAFDHELARTLARIAVDAIEERYRRLGVEAGLRTPRGRSVVVMQRFGADLRLNLHPHGMIHAFTTRSRCSRPRRSGQAAREQEVRGPLDRDLAPVERAEDAHDGASRRGQRSRPEHLAALVLHAARGARVTQNVKRLTATVIAARARSAIFR